MTRALLLLPVTALLLTACSSADSGDGPDAASAPSASASAVDLSAALVDPSGASRGTVSFSFAGGATTLTVDATALPPGLHGFHVHAVGRCEPDSADPAKPATRGDFLSAGGHLAEAGQTHGDHDGDLPSLLVRADGTATLVTTTDRLTRENLLDADGSAVMVHALRDNFANVPDRYAAEVDETTAKTGDAGGRIACATVRS